MLRVSVKKISISITFGEVHRGVFLESGIANSKVCQPRGSPQKFVANVWTEFSAQHGEALAMNGKEPQNPFLFGGCNCGKGKYLRICRASNSQCGGQGFDPPARGCK